MPNATNSTSDNQALPPPTLEETLSKSTAAVQGRLSTWDGQSGSLLVESVIAGEVPSGATLDVKLTESAPPAADWRSGDSGVWFLNNSDGPWLILPMRPNRWSLREIERVLAGLPRIDDPPRSDQIRELASQADAVFYGDVTSKDGTTGRAVVLKVIQGELPGEIDVIAPPEDDQPGGPWRFPTGQPTSGVMFVKKQGDAWAVLNPSDPYLYQPGDVGAALSG